MARDDRMNTVLLVLVVVLVAVLVGLLVWWSPWKKTEAEIRIDVPEGSSGMLRPDAEAPLASVPGLRFFALPV